MTTHTPKPTSYSPMATDGANKISLMDESNYPGASNYTNTLWTWTHASLDWTAVSTSDIDTSGPLPLRTDSAMAYDGTRLVLFGGRGESETSGVLSDTWYLASNAWTKQSPSTVPFGRFGHKMAYLSGTGAVMFGGSNVLNYLNETWVYNGTTWVQQSPTHSPPVRIGHAMAAGGGVVLLFGGQGTNSCLNDCYTYNGTDWTQRTTATPSVRTGASMAYDAANSRFVLFGGKNESGIIRPETWTATNAGVWTQESPATSPSARVGAQMAYDGTNVILFGGAGLTDANAETWSWDGVAKTWTLK